MLFQDERGGLELQDPQMPTFLHATPEEGALVLNVADMLQRFSNGTVLPLPSTQPFARQNHSPCHTPWPDPKELTLPHPQTISSPPRTASPCPLSP